MVVQSGRSGPRRPAAAQATGASTICLRRSAASGSGRASRQSAQCIFKRRDPAMSRLPLRTPQGGRKSHEPGGLAHARATSAQNEAPWHAILRALTHAKLRAKLSAMANAVRRYIENRRRGQQETGVSQLTVRIDTDHHKMLERVAEE